MSISIWSKYRWKVSCLARGHGRPGTAAAGAVMRPATLDRYACEAGSGGIEILPIETPTWRFYRLTT